MSLVVHSFALLATEARPVQVEVDLLRRLPSMVVIGLPGHAVRETADRVRSAVQNLTSHHEWPRQRIVVNLYPADLPKVGTAFDLPIAVGVLAASGQLAQVPDGFLAATAFTGELSLTGQLRPVRGVLAMVQAAAAAGLKRVVVPLANAAEAMMGATEDCQVVPLADLDEVVDWLDLGRLALHQVRVPAVERDLRDTVGGRRRAKRAMEIAAAGGHGVRLIGAPGAPAARLARLLSLYLPDLDPAAALEATTAYAAAGLLSERHPRVQHAPFRAPHHTISTAGMVGALSAPSSLGEVALAHHGVLLLEDVEEFSPAVRGQLSGALGRGSVGGYAAPLGLRWSVPARPILVTVERPCDCRGPCSGGCGGASLADRQRVCADLVARGLRPLVVDLGVPDPEQADALPVVRARVARARRRAAARDQAMPEVLTLGDEAAAHAHRMGWSVRDELLAVARTIADLADSDEVRVEHLEEAASFVA